MVLLCCFTTDETSTKNFEQSHKHTEIRQPGPAQVKPGLSVCEKTKGCTASPFPRKSLSKPVERTPNGCSTPAPSSVHHQHQQHEALLQLLPVLTALEGGWWDQIERAAVATAQHLGAAHVCIFFLSSDGSFASPVALAGPHAPPLSVGCPLPMSILALPPVSSSAPATSAAHTAEAGAAADVATASLTPGPAAAAGPAGVPSCAAAALIAEQCDKDPGRLLLFADASPQPRRFGGGGGGGDLLPASAPPEWRRLASPAGGGSGGLTSGPGDSASGAGGGEALRHFAAVAIPWGHQPIGVLSLGAPGPKRPASWTPETLHCTASLLSTPLRLPQVDLACRALSELSSAPTIHQLVRIILGAATELVVATTRIETQARVAFLQPDVEAAAVFQSAATDFLGPAVRRRLSEVLLVDTSAVTAAAAAGGGTQCGGGGRSTAGPPPTRRSLGGNETVASRCPSLATAGAVMSADAQSDRLVGSSRGANGGEELAVCRGHSLPLKHTLLSEALAQGAGLCISDCNAYVQDSKVYPRDLAVSRDAAPAQSLALATSCHGGRPLLALYATYHSILPQGLLQAVVQELGQLLRALTASVATKVEGSLSAEWGYLRHQLQDSMRNRSTRSLHAPNSQRAATGNGLTDPPAAAAAAQNGAAINASGGGGGNARQIPDVAFLDSAAHPQSLAASTNALGPNALALALDVGAGSGSLGITGSGRSRVPNGGGGGEKRDGRTSGRASFSLEAANSPRGSCKLAPLIATLHDRLKTAQAEQMANCRASFRMQDLESIRILEQIGRGGYGVVFRGLYHGSEVAIKVIQEAEVATTNASGSHGGGGGGALRRMNSVALENKHLHDAIELVASVGMGGHPNIVQVLTFFTDVRVVVGDQPIEATSHNLGGLDGVAELIRLTRMPSVLEGGAGGGGAAESPRWEGSGGGRGDGGAGVIVLVQEFCDAGTLKTAINQRAFYRSTADLMSGDRPSSSRGLQLNLRAVYSTLLEVALALRHMHGLHLVHCDLKPQNVLLKSSPRDPRGFTAKLSDFGLAKMMAHDEDGQLVIDEAVGSGTLTHMAPESLAGQKQLTASIDIFSFGILMWQLVCGTRLYQGLSTRQIIRGVVRENLRPVFPAWVPADYRRLAERCWHPLPSERPTASAVVAELEAMTDQHSRAAWRTYRPVGPGSAGMGMSAGVGGAAAAAAAAAGATQNGGGGGEGAAGLDSPGVRHPHPQAYPQAHTQVQQPHTPLQQQHQHQLQQQQQRAQLQQQLQQQMVAAGHALATPSGRDLGHTGPLPGQGVGMGAHVPLAMVPPLMQQQQQQQRALSLQTMGWPSPNGRLII